MSASDDSRDGAAPAAHVQAEWLSSFGEAYARTYKSSSESSRKNMRCFPRCGPTVGTHSSQGFCGATIEVLVSVEPGLPPNATLEVFGTIRESGAEQQWQPGRRVALQQLLDMTRSKEEPLRPWLRALLSSEAEAAGDAGAGSQENSGAIAVFNSELAGWHYGWLSSKSTCHTQHCFEMYAFSKVGAECTFLGASSSPTFQVYTRHRKGQKQLSRDASYGSSSHSTGDDAAVTAHAPNTKVDEPATVHAALKSKKRGAPGACDATNGTDHDRTAARHMREFGIPTNRTMDRLARFVFRHGFRPQNCVVVPYAEQSVAPLRQWAAPDLLSRKSSSDSNDAIVDEIIGLLHNDDCLTSTVHHPAEPPPASSAASVPGEDDGRRDEGRSAADSPSAEGSGPRGAAAPLDESWGVQKVADLLAAHLESAEHVPEPQARLAGQIFVENIRQLCNELSRNVVQGGSGFFEIIARFGTLEGMVGLKDVVDQEKCIAFEWTRAHEDEDFVVLPPEEIGRTGDPCAERSIYAEARHGFRMLLARCLTGVGLTARDLELAMDLAARHNLISLDAFYPPTVEVARKLHFQIYGHVNDFETNDYGSRRGVYASDAQQAAYAKDIIIVRRNLFRRIVLQRVVNNRRLAQMARWRGGPVEDPAYDISGEWEIVVMHDIGSGAVTNLMSSVSGFAFGSFYAFLHDACSTRIVLQVNSNFICYVGTPVLLAQPILSIALVPGMASVLQVPLPVPVDELAELAVDRVGYAMFDRSQDGRCGVMITVIGQVSHLSTATMIQNAQAKLAQRQAATEPGAAAGEAAATVNKGPVLNIAQFFARQQILPGDEVDTVRLVLRMSLLRREDGMLVHSVSPYLFPRARVVPRLGDEEALCSIISAGECVQTVPTIVKIFRPVGGQRGSQFSADQTASDFVSTPE